MIPVLRAALVLLMLLLPAPAARAADRVLLFSYEVTSAQFGFARLGEAAYADRAAVTAEALAEIVPGILAALGLDPARVETRMTPGGYLGRTNASLQSKAALDPARAEQLAAALGFVFRQSSVLVSDLKDRAGGTGHVTLSFPRGRLDANLAHRFFTHAAGVHKGLAGGYTAFADDMIFLNVRDDAGRPYSELDDRQFAAALATASASFPGAQPRRAIVGTAGARFIENSWRGKPDGADYVARLGGAEAPVMAPLHALQERHRALMNRAADRYLWR
jgi:hypothetical protein